MKILGARVSHVKAKRTAALLLLSAATMVNCGSSGSSKLPPSPAGEAGATDGGAGEAESAGDGPVGGGGTFGGGGAGAAGDGSGTVDNGAGAAGAAGAAGSDGGFAGAAGEPSANSSPHVIGRGAIQVAVGILHTCVLLKTGAVRCWGSAASGELGYADGKNIGDDEFPVVAGDVDVGGAVKQIAAQRATCAVLESGKVRCWGYGADGTLGYLNKQSIGDNETPASAGDIDVGGAVTQLTMSHTVTCAVMSTGALRCWGAAANGVLGYGNKNDIGDDETPASAGEIALSGTVKQASTSVYRTCAALSSGEVRCWGTGYLGYGNNPPSEIPPTIGDDELPNSVPVVNVGGSVTQIVTGYGHTCALLTTGSVRCWGRGAVLGYGTGSTDTIGDDETPASAGDVAIGGKVTQLAAGSDHTCALLDTGAVRCWGEAGAGQLGYGNTKMVGYTDTPASAGDVNVGGKVTQISAAGQDTCALLQSGAVRCWGSNSAGQLGYAIGGNNIGDDETPASAGDVQY